MAENRGNPSGSKSNLPNTRPDGLTRPNNRNSNKDSHDTYKTIDTRTLKEMQTVYKGLTKFAIELGGNLKDFNKVIEKSTDTMVSTRQRLDKTAKEYDAEVAEMKKHYFGANKKIADDYEKFVESKKKLMEDEFEEMRKEERKNIIKQSFKNESKQNEIKFMGNKYSKGNNLVNTSNEYYSQLEKLKSDALDTYGEGFENNKAYKKALMNLNDEYAKNMKDAWKEDFKENHKVLGGIASGIKDTFERNKEALQGLLGPLNLFIAPLKDFFGGFGAVFKFIGGGVKTIFRKFTKKNPTASDVLKSGAYGVGSLYIGHKLDELFGKTKGEGGLSSLKDKLFEPLEGMKEIFSKDSAFMKNARLISGMGGGLMVVADFISEFQKTGDWRGALSKGITGSSKLENAIKGALLGFTIAGPVGLLVGALGGVALNYFSPQVEKFIRLMTGDVSAKKKQLLTNIEKDVKKGKRSQQELDIYTKLAQSGMDDADFASLGRDLYESEKHNRMDWIRQYSKGNLSSLSDEEFNFMGNLFMNKGFDLSNSLGIDKFKILLESLGRVSDDSQLAWIMQDDKTLSNFINYALDVNKGSLLKGEELNKFLKERQISESDFDKIKNLSMFKNLDDATIEVLKNTLSIIDPKNKAQSSTIKYFKDNSQIFDDSINDAIIRTDGKIIKTNPKDTLVALKDIPLSMEQVRNDTSKNLNSSLNSLNTNKDLENKLTTIVDVLSKILAKDIQVNLPPQTRNDLDILMSGGMI